MDDVDAPLGWTLTTLGAIGEYLNGRAFKRSEWSTKGRPIIRIQDLTGSNENPNYFEGDADDKHVVRSGDLLISWSATLGAYIWHGPEAVLNQHIFKVKSNIDPRYHYHAVRDRIAELLENAHGSGMVHVTKGSFEGTPVLVPDEIEVQKAVARVIDFADEKFSSAENHLAVARRAVDRFRKAVLLAACSGRLSADWRVADPDAESVESAIAAHSARRARPSREEPVRLDLPELPDSYVVATLGQVADLIEYGTSKKCDSGPGVPVLRMGNIQNGGLDITDLKYCRQDIEIERLILEDGDLLFNRTNSPELVGKSAVFHEDCPMSFASYLIRVRFDQSIVLPDFANYWLNSAWGRAWAQLAKTDGVSQSNINGSKLALLPLPLPPLKEQEVIVKRASQMLDIADSLLARADATDTILRRGSRSVLAKALRGELLGGANA